MDWKEQVKQTKRAMMVRALLDTGVNCSETARNLKIHRMTVDHICQALDIDTNQLRKHFRSAQVASGVRMTDPIDISRRRLPETRSSISHKFVIGGERCYLTVGMYPDGKPGEIFLHLDKVGTKSHGFADSWAILFSLSLQHGIPLEELVKKFKHTKFEPAGRTQSEGIKFADSIIDYVVRWLELKFLNP